MDRITVGIDVSKARLDVAVRPRGEVFAVARTAAGLEELGGRLAALRPQVVALEASGGFETVAVATLAAAGLPVVVVNPAQIRAFAKALGQRAKTDPIDAAVIAHFAEATNPEPRPLPDAATRLLADLVARRRGPGGGLGRGHGRNVSGRGTAAGGGGGASITTVASYLKHTRLAPRCQERIFENGKKPCEKTSDIHQFTFGLPRVTRPGGGGISL